MAEVVCLGEALIDFVAAESGVGVGEASGFVKAAGGAPANVAVGVARLGRSSAFLGKVGEDPFGRFLAQTFAEAGVDTGGMVFDLRHRTGLAFVSLAANGERDFCFFRNPSADMTYAPAELDRDRITGGRIFHFGSITLIDRAARETTWAALRTARDAGLLLSFDPNLRPALWPSPEAARRTILRAMPSVDVVKVSLEELVFLLVPDAAWAATERERGDWRELGRRLLQKYRNVRLLAITCGAEGCCWMTPKGGPEGALAGWPVQAVDTTGAGDGFAAGMLVGLLDHGLTDAARWAAVDPTTLNAIFALANAVGALTTLQKGAIPALPTAAATAAFRRAAAEAS